MQLEGAEESIFPLTQKQRSVHSPLVKGPGTLHQGDSGDPQKCAVTEGWEEARNRLQLRGRMRPVACRTSSEEDRGNGSQEVAGSTKGASRERGPRLPRGREVLAAGRTGAQPLSPAQLGCW